MYTNALSPIIIRCVAAWALQQILTPIRSICINASLIAFTWIRNAFVCIHTSALGISLEANTTRTISLIVFNVSWIRSCVWPYGCVSIAIRLCIFWWWWIVLRVSIRTFGCGRCCWCSGCRGRGDYSWLFASERTFRISAFEWFSTIMTAKCTLIIIIAVPCRGIQCVARATALQSNASVWTNCIITSLRIQAVVVINLALLVQPKKLFYQMILIYK